MNLEITKKDLNAWRKEYHKNSQNKMIEDIITRVGIDDGSIP